MKFWSQMVSREFPISQEHFMRARCKTERDTATVCSHGPMVKATRGCGIWGCRMDWALQNTGRGPPTAESGILGIAMGMKYTT